MKLFVVEGSYYDYDEGAFTSHWIVGVYSSVELAHKVCMELYSQPIYKDDEGYGFSIWEKDLDGKPET